MIEYDRAVTPKEWMCRRNFSSKSLAEGASLVDLAKKKFEKDGVVPAELVRAMMEADGITSEFLLADGERALVRGLLVRAIGSSQWFLVHGKNIHGEL